VLKKYFVTARGRDFSVTIEPADSNGEVRMQVTSEAGVEQRHGRVVAKTAAIDGRILRLDTLSQQVQLGNRHHRLLLSVSDRPKLDVAQATARARSRHRLSIAPLPGQVVSVLVRPNERVRAGQRLLLIEAMKMQNPILAERDGLVLQVFVNPGDTVQVGARLVEMGD